MLYLYFIINKQTTKDMKNQELTFEQMTEAKALLGQDVTDLEYAEHLVLMNGGVYFQLIHLNGSKRFANVLDFIGK